MGQYYHDTITEFIGQSFETIWAQLTAVGRGDLLHTQKQAWAEQMKALKTHLNGFTGDIFFEYSIPRMGKRIDAALLIDGMVFVVEFKVGAKEFTGADVNQILDYTVHHASVAYIRSVSVGIAGASSCFIFLHQALRYKDRRFRNGRNRASMRVPIP